MSPLAAGSRRAISAAIALSASAILAAGALGAESLPARRDDGPPPAIFSTASRPSRTMTLDEALTYARTHQPTLRSALARVSAAAAETRVSRARWLPSLGASVQAFEGTTNNTTASYLGALDVDIPRIGATRATGSGGWGASSSTLAAVGLRQEIYDFGRVAAEAAVADVALESERHRADAERLRLDLLVKDAFYGVWGAHAVLRVAEDAYGRALAHRDLAAAEVKTGLQPPIELTRVAADLSRFDVGRIRAAGALWTAQAVFAASVGVDDRLLDAAAEPPEGPAAPPLDRGLKLLLERDPILQEAQSRARGAEAKTRGIAAEMRPDLTLSATFSGRAGTATPAADDGALPTIPNWDVGLVLRLPLYDGVVTARREAASARAEAARADVEMLSQQETAALEQAYVSLDVAQTTLTGLGEAVRAARANYDQAEARFKAGLGTSLELGDAESLRTDAEIQLAVGRFDALRARALVARFTAETR
jgi:outer membrane protein